MSTAMPSPNLSYEELTHRLVQAEGIVTALRSQEADAIIGTESVAFVRHREEEEAGRRAFERLELLAQIASELLASNHPQGILDTLCRKTIPHLGCDVFLNFLVDASKPCLVLNASGGVPPEFVQQIQRLDFGVGVCGTVALLGSPMVLEHLQTNSDPHTRLARSLGIEACAGYPLQNQGETIGTLFFGSRTKRTFTDDERTLVQAVSDQVAIAIQRMRLMESLEQRVAERTAEAECRAHQLRALASELTQTEQRERRRLAQILHDHLQQLLVAAKLQLSFLSRKAPNETLAQPFRQVQELLEQAIAESRSLAVELSPPILFERGLLGALEWLARQFLERHQLSIRLDLAPEAEPQDVGTRIFLFQVIRELLLNVVKHAQASEAQIELHCLGDESLRAVVSDTGIGFNPSKLENREPSGFGLFSIRERLQLIGGRMDVDAAQGRGTRMQVEIPRGPAISPAGRARKIVAAVSTVTLDSGNTVTLKPSPEERPKTRILVADDHRVVREGLITMLNEHPEIEVVGEAADGQQALDLACRMRPDVVLMDITMPVMDGIEATRHIINALPDTQVIGLSMHQEEEMVTAMRRAGAVAFLSKDTASDHLIDLIVHRLARTTP